MGRLALIAVLVWGGWACSSQALLRDAGPAPADTAVPSHDGASERVPDVRPVGDAGFSCANVGCAAPPLCTIGCTAACGCCRCTPGERNGDLVCVDTGCYEPGPVRDAAPADLASVDLGHADADPGTDGGARLCGDLGRPCAASEVCVQRWSSQGITFFCGAVPASCAGQSLDCSCLESLICGFDFACTGLQDGSFACVSKG
jgi:hypothetical protein